MITEPSTNVKVAGSVTFCYKCVCVRERVKHLFFEFSLAHFFAPCYTEVRFTDFGCSSISTVVRATKFSTYIDT